MEMMIMKEGVCTHRSLETGVRAHDTGPHGEVPGVWQEADGMMRKHGRESLL